MSSLGVTKYMVKSSHSHLVTSEHCTKLRVGHAKLGEAGEAGNGYTASFAAIFQDTPMIRPKNWGLWLKIQWVCGY